VLYIDFAGYTADQDLRKYIKDTLQVFIDDHTLWLKDLWWEYLMTTILKNIYEKTGKQAVIIVDEYDKPVLQYLHNAKKAEEMRNFFASFYAWIKWNDDKIKLFMLTWLTKVLKMSVFSVLNNLKDLSFSGMWYNLMWYTQSEVESNFDEEIEEIMKKEWKTREEILQRIKINYYGYNFGKDDDTIYNPRNINNLFLEKKFSYYWADTGIPSAVLHYIDKNSIKVDDFIRKLKEWTLRITETNFKLEDLHNIKPEVLFTNAGYLTILRFDTENNIYTLWYPNTETEKVMDDFLVNLIKPNYDFSEMEELANLIYEGITLKENNMLEEWLNRMIYEFMAETAYEWTNKDPEWWFKTILGLFLRLNTIYFYPEVQNLKGRKDFVIPLWDTYYILEAKVDESIETAMKQIEEKYIPQLRDGKKIIKVGINWAREMQKVESEMRECDDR